MSGVSECEVLVNVANESIVLHRRDHHIFSFVISQGFKMIRYQNFAFMFGDGINCKNAVKFVIYKVSKKAEEVTRKTGAKTNRRTDGAFSTLFQNFIRVIDYLGVFFEGNM